MPRSRPGTILRPPVYRRPGGSDDATTGSDTRIPARHGSGRNAPPRLSADRMSVRRMRLSSLGQPGRRRTGVLRRFQRHGRSGAGNLADHPPGYMLGDTLRERNRGQTTG